MAALAITERKDHSSKTDLFYPRIRYIAEKKVFAQKRISFFRKFEPSQEKCLYFATDRRANSLWDA